MQDTASVDHYMKAKETFSGSHEAEAWGETAIEIPEGVWRNWLTGERVLGGRVRVGELLEKFPVALLTHDA